MSANLQEVPAHLCSVEDAAKRLCVSTQTIRDWVKSGRLKGFRAGRIIRVSTAAVHEALVRGSLPPAPRKIGRGQS